MVAKFGDQVAVTFAGFVATVTLDCPPHNYVSVALLSDLADAFAESEGRLGAKIDRIDRRLTKFEEDEVDKRLQLEVRVHRIEKHLGLPAQSRS